MDAAEAAHGPSGADGGRGAPAPLYARVRDGLRGMVERQELPAGFVLLEGPVAAFYRVSRVPVRRALSDLAQEGLIRRFRGRGYLVDPEGVGPQPLRVLFPAAGPVAGPPDPRAGPRRYAWQRIHDDIARTVAAFLPFGAYRIRETELCARFDVSRTVVREVLTRLMARGLIEKDDRSHWIAGPFTARSNREQYAMRALLEPAALLEAAPSFTRRELEAMLARLDALGAAGTRLTAGSLAALEDDLHIGLVGRCANARLRSTIVQNQLPLSINRAFYGHFGVAADEPMLEEHRAVLAALLAGRPEAAASALADHLYAAAGRSLARLKVMAVVREPEMPAFLERLHR